MTLTEKLLARANSKRRVSPGDNVGVNVFGLDTIKGMITDPREYRF